MQSALQSTNISLISTCIRYIMRPARQARRLARCSCKGLRSSSWWSADVLRTSSRTGTCSRSYRSCRGWKQNCSSTHHGLACGNSSCTQTNHTGDIQDAPQEGRAARTSQARSAQARSAQARIAPDHIAQARIAPVRIGPVRSGPEGSSSRSCLLTNSPAFLLFRNLINVLSSVTLLKRWHVSFFMWRDHCSV